MQSGRSPRDSLFKQSEAPHVSHSILGTFKPVAESSCKRGARCPASALTILDTSCLLIAPPAFIELQPNRGRWQVQSQSAGSSHGVYFELAGGQLSGQPGVHVEHLTACWHGGHCGATPIPSAWRRQLWGSVHVWLAMQETKCQQASEVNSILTVCLYKVWSLLGGWSHSPFWSCSATGPLCRCSPEFCVINCPKRSKESLTLCRAPWCLWHQRAAVSFQPAAWLVEFPPWSNSRLQFQSAAVQFAG